MKIFQIVLITLCLSCASKQDNNHKNIYYLDQKTPSEIPEVFGKGIVSVQGRFEMGFTISPDMKTIAFGVAHESNVEETCIYIMKYINGKWTAPDKSILPDNVNTFYPMFDHTGSEFYFAKSANGAETDLWMAEYLNDQMKNPQLLDSIINSNAREAGHGKSKSGPFYFTSNRDDQNQCCGDIYRSELVAEGYTKVEKVNELNSEADEEGLFLSPSGNYIIIQSWKSEFESKHDLYLSYQTKNGTWTNPERLNSKINGKDIEQRPFVSPDNKFLFFSRMSITQVDGQDNYESDTYWVSTRSIFKPYPFNTDIEVGVRYNEPFQFNLPDDLFKDVDDIELQYKMSLDNDSELPEWIKFDSTSLSLSGVWKSKEPLSIKVTASDSAGNDGSFILKLEEKATNKG